MADGKAGAPEGNQNAAKKNRIFGETLRKVLLQDREKLRKICEKLADKAAEGDVQAIKEVRDTLDGKPVQAIEGTGDNGEFSFSVTKVYVSADNGKPSG